MQNKRLIDTTEIMKSTHKAPKFSSPFHPFPGLILHWLWQPLQRVQIYPLVLLATLPPPPHASGRVREIESL